MSSPGRAVGAQSTRHVLLVVVAMLIVGGAPAALAQCPETSVPMAGALSAGDEFGTSVAVAGDVLLIGAPGWAPPGGQPEGAAVVSTWTGSAWVSSLLPRPTTLTPGSRFGQDVALNEDATVLVVGAPLHDGGAVDGGKVVIYEWDAGLATWVITLDVDGAFTSGLFGWSVSASGDFVAAGEPGGVFGLGSVSVSRRTAPATWVADGFLVGSELFGTYGFDVAVDVDPQLGDTLLAVGVPLLDGVAVDEGAVDVHERQGGAWPLREHVTDFAHEAGMFFGWSVDLDDEQLVAGAPGASASFPGGHMQVFAWQGPGYLGLLSHWATTGASRLGQSVALDEDRVAVGAPGMDMLGLGSDTGRASVFSRSPWGYWQLQPVYTTGTAPEAGAQFAFSTALHAERVVLGQPFASVGGLASAGRVHVLDSSSALEHTDLGQGLAGWNGVVPTLTGVGGPCDLPWQVLPVLDARPGAPIWLVLGLDEEPLPFKGGVLVPAADMVLFVGNVPPSGQAGLEFTLPTGLPAYSVWWQFWFQDADGPWGFSATNALRADYPPY